MNGTVDTADLLSGRFDAPLWRQILDCNNSVSNNLGVYFLLACVAAGPRTRLNPLYTEGLERLRRRLLFIVFVCFRFSCSFFLSFYAKSANKPVFLCFTSPSLAGF